MQIYNCNPKPIDSQTNSNHDWLISLGVLSELVTVTNWFLFGFLNIHIRIPPMRAHL